MYRIFFVFVITLGAFPLAAASSPIPDVAASDRVRILKAADAAPALDPLTITQPVLWLHHPWARL